MSNFNKNVYKLILGTSLAQAIPIVISPVLTRLYTPDEFGVFALYVSLSTIISVIVTGRYELAIILPRSDKDARNLLALAVGLSFFLSTFLYIIIYLFNNEISLLLGNSDIQYWLYFLPLTVLFTGCYQSIYYWVNRQKQYGSLSVAKVVNTSSAGTTNLVAGFMGAGPSGLILGNVIGQLFALSFLSRDLFKGKTEYRDHLSFMRMSLLARRYKDFPKFDILASLMNALAHQTTIIFFGSFYSVALAGQYFLTQRVLGMPIMLVAASISDVFREEAARDFMETGSAKVIFVRTFIKLILLSFLPAVTLLMYAQDLFVFAFGEDWRIAGEYAQVLSPMLFLKFVVSPLSFMFFIAGKQNFNLIGNSILLFATFMSFYLTESIIDTITFLSCAYSVVYLLYLIVSARLAKVF
jgi:O-antigen/teichoic acid export membrane protein